MSRREIMVNETPSITLSCIMDGQSFDNVFNIKVGLEDDVDTLKLLIKKYLAPSLDNVCITDIRIFQDNSQITDSVARLSGQAERVLGHRTIEKHWPSQPSNPNAVDVVIRINNDAPKTGESTEQAALTIRPANNVPVRTQYYVFSSVGGHQYINAGPFEADYYATAGVAQNNSQSGPMDILPDSDGADISYGIFSFVGGHQYGSPSNPTSPGWWY